jgi:hypothetical protein
VNVLDVPCDYETRIKAIVFMSDKEEEKKSLWHAVKRLVGDDSIAKNEAKCPSTPFSCCDRSAQDDFEEQYEQLRDSDREKIKTLQNLLDQAMEIIVAYRGKIRYLKNENDELKRSIFLMNEAHEFQKKQLELKLKHHARNMLTPPST